MKIYYVDTEGWWYWEDSIEGIENSLELIDIAREEYLIVDSNGNIYNYIESNEGYYGYILVKSGRKDKKLTRIFDQQVENQKMYQKDLQIARRYSTRMHSV